MLVKRAKQLRALQVYVFVGKKGLTIEGLAGVRICW